MKKKIDTATVDTLTEEPKTEYTRPKPGVLKKRFCPRPLSGAALCLDDDTLAGVRQMAHDIAHTLCEKIVRGTDAALVTLRECSTDEEKKIVKEFYMQNMSDLCDMLLDMLRTRFENNISGSAEYKDAYEGCGWLI